MENQKSFWRFVERFKLLIELILLLITFIPSVWAVIKSGLSAVIPAWYVLAASAPAIFLGYLWGRGRKVANATKKSIVRKEFYSAIWEIDELSNTIDGPFCKTCSVKMIPKVNSNPSYIVFACKNPECPNRGSITKSITNITNIEDVFNRVFEQIQAEKRRETIAKELRSH